MLTESASSANGMIEYVVFLFVMPILLDFVRVLFAVLLPFGLFVQKN